MVTERYGGGLAREGGAGSAGWVGEIKVGIWAVNGRAGSGVVLETGGGAGRRVRKGNGRKTCLGWKSWAMRSSLECGHVRAASPGPLVPKTLSAANTLFVESRVRPYKRFE